MMHREHKHAGLIDTIDNRVWETSEVRPSQVSLHFFQVKALTRQRSTLDAVEEETEVLDEQHIPTRTSLKQFLLNLDEVRLNATM